MKAFLINEQKKRYKNVENDENNFKTLATMHFYHQ